MDIKLKGGYSRMTGWTTLNHPEYDRGFRNGQQSKQAQINKALELLRQPMQGTVADLLNELEDILDDT